MKPLDVSGKSIGQGHPCFIIAEAGVNHNGEMELARRLVDAAVDAGADAVKFQAFKAAALVDPNAPKADYQLQTTDRAESQFEMIRRLELSADALQEIQAYCASRGTLFLATPFDDESAALLDAMDVPLFKVSSGEVTNLAFLTRLARFGRPIMLSTGMCDLAEVTQAVQTIRAAGNDSIMLLQCVSNYPADPADSNLRAMQTMSEALGVAVGYSDHTLGNEVALAAVALGACVVEKHLTLDRGMAGPDHRASSEPAEFGALVRGIRAVESALGDGCKRPAASERNTAEVARKSLVAARDLPAGATLTAEMLTAIRPGTGLSPALQGQVVGRRLRQAIAARTPLTFEMLD
jgi:N-acetylneuraminate synthase